MRIKDGIIYTPATITKKMINSLGDLNGKKILEPSCGTGNFLINIIKKINKKYYKNLIAFDIDEPALNKAKENSTIMSNIEYDWKFYNKDFLSLDENEKYDIIIGNPPYIKAHDLEKQLLENIKSSFISCREGTIDIYFAFIEKSIRLLNENGILKFIIPNSWMGNNSAKNLRKILIKYDIEVIDFGSVKVFDGVSIYTCILTVKNIKSNKLIIKDNTNEFFLDKKELLNGEPWIKKNNVKELINLNIKNGVATLSDNSFIFKDFKIEQSITTIYSKITQSWHKIENKIIRNIYKASTLEKNICIFPYKPDGTPYNEKELMEEFPLTYKYLNEIKPTLLKRAYDSEWYLYGRSQAIKSSFGKKVILSPLANKNGFKYMYVEDACSIIYSGYYILTNANEYKDIIKNLKSENLIKFVLNNGRRMGSNWVSFSKKLLDKYNT